MQRTWSGLLICLLASACGDGKKTAESAAEAVFTEVCGHVFSCCSTGEASFYLGPYTDANTCVERLVDASRAGGVTLGPGPLLPGALSFPSLELLDHAISQGRLEVDDAGLEACVEWLRGLTCNTAEPTDPEPVCEPPEIVEDPCRVELLFRGRVGEGGECSSLGSTLQCGDGLVCRTFDALGAIGVCAAPGDVDDFCFTDAECRPGLHCQQLDGTCQTPGEVGEACQFADPLDPDPPAGTLVVGCAPGLSCDPLIDRCVAPCQQGAACATDAECDAAAGLLCVLSRCDLPRDLGLACGTDAHCRPEYRCEQDPGDPSRRICSPKIPSDQPCPFGGHTECASGFCDPTSGACAGTVAPPGHCSSGIDAQCQGGWCDTTYISCLTDTECPDSMFCSPIANRCEYFCAEPLGQGEPCLRSPQCASGACVQGFCVMLPLGDGEPCDANFECASGFCGFDSPRVCATLPLAQGEPCTSGNQCSSGVCFVLECVAGLSEGDACGDPADPPCSRDLYCDFGGSPQACVRAGDAGATCESDDQCRGDCVEVWSRQMCEPTPPPDGAICDGG